MNSQQHLWDNQWFRDLMLILIVVVLLLVAYSLQAILLPIVASLALAYAFHPLITWLEKRVKIPRWLSTMGILAIALALFLGIMIWITPQLVGQTRSLINRLPGYGRYATQQIEAIREWTDQRGRELLEHANLPLVGQSEEDQEAQKTDEVQSEPVVSDQPDASPAEASPTTPPPSQTENAKPNVATEQGNGTGTAKHAKGGKGSLLAMLDHLDMSTVGSVFLNTFSVGWNVVGATISVGMYLALSAILMLFGFFYFSWKFDLILRWFAGFIPESSAPRITHILSRMDRAIAAFIRGRLLQVSLLTCVLCIGWAWVGVPYWLLLGVLAGALNLVPYAAMLSWPVAVMLMWIDTASGSSGVTFSFMQVFIWPSVVYLIGQGLDGWVVEPLVQGKATNLDPFSVLVAVILGGSLFGIMGTIVAVPAAACLKIFSEEVVLPRIRQIIKERGALDKTQKPVS